MPRAPLMCSALLLGLLFGCVRANGAEGPALQPLARQAAWWQERVRQIEGESAHSRPELLLVGDSITYGWRFAGQAAWRRAFGALPTLNMGVDGDQLAHLLWRIQHGALERLAPKLIVLMIGVNNILQPRQPAEQIAVGVRAIVLELHRRLPRARLLLLGILPCGRRPGPQRDKIMATNRLLARLADRRLIHYLDIGHKLLGPRGELPATIAHDELHLTPRGYAIWAAAMAPSVHELLGHGALGGQH